MSTNAQRDRLALVTAEEVLRTVFGDDFAGCPVSLEKVAAVIQGGLQQAESGSSDVLGLYEKVVEAVHLLSTPPSKDKVTDPVELRTLLTERLDAIHVVTTKTMATTALVKAERSKPSGPKDAPADSQPT